MPVEADITPRGPFSLRLSARGSVVGRSYRDGVFAVLMDVDGRSERGIAAQRRDGSLRLRAETEKGLEQLRFVLALDNDHAEFLRRRSEEHTSELQSHSDLVCRILREKKKALPQSSDVKGKKGKWATKRQTKE